MIAGFLMFAWDYLVNCLGAIFLGIGMVTVAVLVRAWWRLRSRSRRVTSPGSPYEAGRDYRGPSVTRLHGAGCRCMLCCIEGKGKGGSPR